MLYRLGNVIYLFSCVIAALICMFAFADIVSGDFNSLWFLVIAFIIWAVGRASYYILSDE